MTADAPRAAGHVCHLNWDSPVTAREVEYALRQMAEGLIQKRWTFRTVVPRLRQLAGESGRSEALLRNMLETWRRDLERSPWS